MVEKKTDIVYIKTGDVVPDGMVVMTMQDAEKFQKEKLYQWKNKWQIWPLWYVPHMQLLPIAATSYGFSLHYRKVLDIAAHRAFFSTIAVPFLMPTFLSALLYDSYIRPKILTHEYTCSMCLSTRVGAMQCLMSACYVHICSMVSCVFKADQRRVPSLFDWRGMFRFVWDISPSRNIILPVYLAHFAMGTFFCSAAIDKFENVFSVQANDRTESMTETDFQVPN